MKIDNTMKTLILALALAAFTLGVQAADTKAKAPKPEPAKEAKAAKTAGDSCCASGGSCTAKAVLSPKAAEQARK